MVIMGPPLTLISIVKPKRGVGSHVEIWVPRREELGPTGSHRAQFGSHRSEELGPTGSHQVSIRTRARLVVLRARFWVQKMLMLPASTWCASIVA